MEFDGYELKTIKNVDYSIEVGNYNYIIYELLNGDIVFNIPHNKFCYFNIKVFSVQIIIEINNKEIINKFNQLNDKNYFYFFADEICYEFNTKGKITRKEINNTTKPNSKVLGDYYINYYNKKMNIISANNKKNYTKNCSEKINDIIIINEKDKIFAFLEFAKPSYTMQVCFFKLKKHNN